MTDKRTFTDSFIRALKPQAAPYKLAEHAHRGEGRLIVRVLPSGVKEFFYRYRPAGEDKTLALGRYDGAGRKGRTLAAVRAELRQQRALQRSTGDVKAHLQLERRQKALTAQQGSLEQLLTSYVDRLRTAGKPSADDVEGIFRRHVLEPFRILAETKANEITTDDIKRVLNRMIRKGITRQVNITRAYLRAAYAHGMKADGDPRTVARDGILFGLSVNPVINVLKIAEYEHAGDRTLTEDELRAYWLGLEALPLIQRATLRFNLAIACQRPTQLLRADWGAFDFEAPTLLLKDSKGKGAAREHLLPLSPFAIEQLTPLRELNDDDTPPFASDGKRPMVVETLSKAVAAVSDSLTTSARVPSFDQRDLRRTAETMLQKMGVDKEVRAHLLSHGRSQGVQGKHYERYDFLPEKRAAMERWAAHLERVIDPSRRAKVVPMRGRAA